MTLRIPTFALALVANISVFGSSAWEVVDRRFDELILRSDVNSGDPVLQRPILLFLSNIAEGRAGRISSSLAAEFGFPPEELKHPLYSTVEIRSLAFHHIGKLRTAEALEYLEALKYTQFDEPYRFALWSASRRALFDAKLSLISEPEERMLFLEEVLTSEHHPASVSLLSDWARNQLCDGGFLAALPAVAASTRRSYSAPAADEFIAFCQERMWAIASRPNRLMALESVLANASLGNEKLKRWVIAQLVADGTEEAAEVLVRFEQRVASMPLAAGSPRSKHFEELVDYLRAIYPPGERQVRVRRQ